MDKIENVKESWTQLHDMALIYVALAHGTDRQLVDQELDEISARLSEWRKDLSHEDVQEVVMEALVIYLEGNRQEEITRSMLRIKKDVPVLERVAMLDDLKRIAEADGEVVANEEGLIRSLVKIWDVEPHGTDAQEERLENEDGAA